MRSATSRKRLRSRLRARPTLPRRTSLRSATLVGGACAWRGRPTGGPPRSFGASSDADGSGVVAMAAWLLYPRGACTGQDLARRARETVPCLGEVRPGEWGGSAVLDPAAPHALTPN